ncbi:MAG: 5-(carboxyamino)imidazole ribonucleotide synthase [Brevibacterium sp.]|nr:5-(carboxyamino)imidazole ribonucleotide synthase [Brevibacterium sp.]MDN6134007.1 5-(carboxyamino)imidazole ribonucleotide synthase [Brevibacterium sp.]MDN6157978.1 5-(carboxyamino)imidazole ribonucleotide synthase [Brevibacterium sp.]MDN6174513.1 5-(carboxyamino)imidazole ribonucleotide synthase [Brevibacterium sp.]MDN6192435.1 5-(carboxyamino)imidazole ribonucleotide synthase [Brevibacterium sp.]
MANVTFPRVGVIGGGQLARMLAPAAEALGIRFSVLAETSDAPATQVINEVSVGDYNDFATLKAFAETVDVVTFDHEHVPPEHLQALAEAGHAVRPGPQALIFAQDKILMRRRMDELGLPNPAWAEITSRADVEAFVERVGFPFILKTPRGGYDGKGVRVIDTIDEALTWLDEVGQLLAEEKVDFTRELAVMVGRSPMGQTAVWPVVETWQQNGVCKEAIAPAPGLASGKATEITEAVLTVAGALDVTGVMAMELFETAEGFLINEFAMRPHNTGHWTQDGAVTSQFEQHLRAVLDLPLGSPAAREDVSVMVNVLGAKHEDLYQPYLHVMAHDPAIKVHLYGKGVRPGRKVGHVNAYGQDTELVLARARHAADFIAGVDVDPHPQMPAPADLDANAEPSADHAGGTAATANDERP